MASSAPLLADLPPALRLESVAALLAAAGLDADGSDLASLSPRETAELCTRATMRPTLVKGHLVRCAIVARPSCPEPDAGAARPRRGSSRTSTAGRWTAC